MEKPGHDEGTRLVPETAVAVLRRLERALAQAAAGTATHTPQPTMGGKPALATDADNTLWDGDVGFDLFESLLEARGARPEALPALRREAEECGIAIDAGADAHAVASALYAAFQAERYPEERAFAMMAWAFAGWHEDELSAFVDQVQRARGLDARVRPGLRAMIDWARGHGLEVWVVSASPRAAVVRGVQRLHITPDRVLAMTPRVESGVIRPDLAAPATYGEGKVQALARERPGLELLAAFGDSVYDAPMLRAAAVPVAITPSPKLLELASTIPGLVLLER